MKPLFVQQPQERGTHKIVAWATPTKCDRDREKGGRGRVL